MKINYTNNPVPYKHQKGAATLLISVIMVVLITLITVFATRVGVMEQKISANDARYKEAFASAESGMENAIRYVKKNSTLIIDAAAAAAAAGKLVYTDEILSTADYTVTIERSTASNSLIEVISTGLSEDGSGTATVRQMLGFYLLNQAGDGPDAPLIVDGAIDVSGGMEVVGNPNGGGAGVPVSMWSDDTITMGNASAGSCHLHEYLDSDGMLDAVNNPDQICAPNNCFCPVSERISNTDGNNTPGYDTVSLSSGYTAAEIAEKFPTDMFEYVTGTPGADWEDKKNEITNNGGLYTDCDSLDASTTGNIWIEGDCSIDGDVGSVSDPVLLIVHGDLTISGGKIFGVAFVYESTGEVKVTGNGAVYGSLISDKPMKVSGGSFDIVYQKKILQAIYGDGSNNVDGISDAFKEIARVAGTWRDF